jgi:hypothetical protein
MYDLTEFMNMLRRDIYYLATVELPNSYSIVDRFLFSGQTESCSETNPATVQSVLFV